MRWASGALIGVGALAAGLASAQPTLPVVTLTPAEGGGETWSVNLQILALMTGITLLPTAVLMMTAFTRIVIVLALLRQALGTATTPSNPVLIGLALFLTWFVMTPVFDQIYSEAVAPYIAEEATFTEAIQRGREPLEAFMRAQTRESDLALFIEISDLPAPATREEIPLQLLLPAFVTSELKTAFQIGFLLFIPFLIIDLVVASVLMAMGMMMLSPLVISFPFKLMLFVLVDGWGLIVATLSASFQVS